MPFIKASCPFLPAALTFCVAIGICLAGTAAASPKLAGLEKHKDLATYIQKNVISSYEENKDTTSPSTLQAQLNKALRSQGYYDARVMLFEENGEIVIAIRPGEQFHIKTVSIKNSLNDLDLPIQSGAPLIAQHVLEAQKIILQDALVTGCIYNLSVSHKALLYPATHTADVEFDVSGIHPTYFGQTSFTGQTKIKHSFLEKFLTYKQGDCWQEYTLEDSKVALMQTDLISSIEVIKPDMVAANEEIPITYVLKERAPRRVKLGANYNTSEGVGVSAAWEHRNFRGEGETFSVGTSLSTIKQKLETSFDKPYFLSDKQSLALTGALLREDNDSYEEININTTAALKRQLSDTWSGSLGVGLEVLQIRENNGPLNNFGLVSFPGSLNYDSRDDVLNPKKGQTFALNTTPFIDAFGTSAPFYKNRLTGTTYFLLSEHASTQPVLALRGSVGSILGGGTGDIPASKRFYAGGGGSIRGFGYQEVGPRDQDNDPRGGRSLLETNTELRLRLGESWGAVAFVDAGGIYNSSVPDFNDGVYIGAGLGARYYTSFGPIRFDIGVPLNKKEDLDQNFQIYISIGQAF